MFEVEIKFRVKNKQLDGIEVVNIIDFLLEN